MIGLLLLAVLGVSCILTSARLLHDPSSEPKPERATGAWLDVLIFGLCLAGIVARKVRESDEED